METTHTVYVHNGIPRIHPPILPKLAPCHADHGNTMRASPSSS